MLPFTFYMKADAGLIIRNSEGQAAVTLVRSRLAPPLESADLPSLPAAGLT
jgi:hypothetical protein